MLLTVNPLHQILYGILIIMLEGILTFLLGDVCMQQVHIGWMKCVVIILSLTQSKMQKNVIGKIRSEDLRL